MAESPVPGAVGERPDLIDVTDKDSLRERLLTDPVASFFYKLGAAIEAGEVSGGAVGEREELLDVERLERIVYDIYGEHDRHRIGHPDHRGTCQDARPHPHDFARQLMARLSVNEGGIAPPAAEDEGPLIDRILAVIANDEGGAELYEAAFALYRARRIAEAESSLAPVEPQEPRP